MISLNVRIPQGARGLRLLDAKAVRTAEFIALNRTAANVQKLSLKLVAEEMGITVAKLRKRGRRVTGRAFGAVSKGKRATPRRLLVKVTGYGRPFNVG